MPDPFSKLILIEITDKCQLNCPICYSNSSPERGHRTFEQIEFMLDSVVRQEPDAAIQITGGEPTIHPEIERILDAARKLRIKHLSLDTNGLRISQDDEFARRLLGLMPDFEVSLQFDSLRESVLRDIRGEDFTGIRQRALFRLNKLNLPTTLTVTVKKGQNDAEIGNIIDFALKQPCVGGVIFQPVRKTGRIINFDPAKHRLTLAEIRQRMLEQCPRMKADDVVAVSSYPQSMAVATLPKAESQFAEANRLQILIMESFDPQNSDASVAKQAWVHIVHPDGRIIPFDMYSTFYRDEKANAAKM
jgi:7,8-dihydro-6-hydroxymethylpterin dimethyltransferase